jgi:cyclopropane fatty-acyl-phospholipid synthase-like methyltransferase
MALSYTEIFKYSDVFNPISSTTLFLAGKLAELAPRQVVLDLGSGKGNPSLLWASVFGVHVEGYDQERRYVEYANARAAMLHLSSRVKYYCQDVKQIKTTRKYDVVASLGLGVTSVYGDVQRALNVYQTLLCPGGFVIFAEPIWLEEHVSSETLKALGADETDFLTNHEFNRLIRKLGFHRVPRQKQLRS